MYFDALRPKTSQRKFVPASGRGFTPTPETGSFGYPMSAARLPFGAGVHDDRGNRLHRYIGSYRDGYYSFAFIQA